MRKIFGNGLRAGAVVVMVAGVGGRATGTVTLVETVEPIDATLTADGWIGVKLTLVADAASGAVAGMDFKNVVRIGGTPVVPLGEAIGVSGPVHQAWVEQGGEIDETPSKTPAKAGGATDSYFMNTSLMQAEDAFDEDNNLETGGGAGNFLASPLVDTVDGDGDGELYGVGSEMTFSAGVTWQNQEASLDIAFLIVPAGMSDVYLRGTVIDHSYGIFAIDQVVNPVGLGEGGVLGAETAVPEAGTLGLLALGAILLGKRKRSL